MDRRTLGRAGERLAAAHLKVKGNEILERNVYTARGELDLIARSPEGVIVFVEVRTRRGAHAAEEAAASVDMRKQRRLHELAATYLAEHAPHAEARIDVITVAVERDGRVADVTHYENAVDGE
ncbi:MAG TPA: YraN family protein [Dehalococcoidia bacterium]|nr:YraN family protein [Dehalococcoidia bacterium]